MNVAHPCFQVVHLIGIEGNDAVSDAESDQVRGPLMQLAVRVFMVGEAVSLYVGHKPVLASHILPDAIERAYPQVVIVVTHNGPDGYGAQSLASREGNSAAFLPLIDIKSIVGTDDDVAIGFLADALNHLVSKYLVPSQGIEMVVGSVETAESVGSSNPQNALTVTHERMHPVVAYMSVFGSHHVVGEVALSSPSRGRRRGGPCCRWK